MFDGMPDQFYQFLASSSRATTLNHGSGSFPTYSPPQTCFDSSNYLLNQPQLAPLMHFQQASNKSEDHKQEIIPPNSGLPASLEEDGEISSILPQLIHPPWSNDEVLALLRIRSSIDNNWFPDFIWENVSRKLGELGFKRSAEKCKEKFEEETRSFNNSITNNCSNNKNISNNNYRLFGELEELYNNNNHGDNNHNHHQSCSPNEPLLLSQRNQSPKNGVQNEDREVEEDKTEQERLGDEEQSVDDSVKTKENTKSVMKKRKRQKKFEIFKGFCENIVNKMIAQQEELHCKILQDMVKRDEEKFAKEEAWKKHEIERIQKEIEVRVHEQAINGDRQAKILDFLKKFSSHNTLETQCLDEAIENLIKVPNTSSNSNSILSQDSINVKPTSSSCTIHDQNPSSLVTQKSPKIPTSLSNENLALQSPNRVDNSNLALPMSPSFIVQASQNPNHLSSISTENDSFRLVSVPTHKSLGLDHTSTDATDHIIDFRSPEKQVDLKPNLKDDTGGRWPRDEVLALINIRCNLFNNNSDPQHDRESPLKGPLWERISKKMLELGYKRSAKRCKEKWENINKYFRKTKDLNKKRSIDSRTCPYFQQLSHLYGQGTLVGPSDRPVNVSASPENISMPLLGAQVGSNGATSTMHFS